jgi:hypothetical protein
MTPKIVQCNQEMTGQAIGNALYGLQSMSSDKGEMREIILALILKIVRCNQELTG